MQLQSSIHTIAQVCHAVTIAATFLVFTAVSPLHASARLTSSSYRTIAIDRVSLTTASGKTGNSISIGSIQESQAKESGCFFASPPKFRSFSKQNILVTAFNPNIRKTASIKIDGQIIHLPLIEQQQNENGLAATFANKDFKVYLQTINLPFTPQNKAIADRYPGGGRYTGKIIIERSGSKKTIQVMGACPV
jgi:hypothetical protein